MWSLRLKKKTNLRVPSFSGVVRGGCVRTRKTLGGGDNFWLVNTCKAGEWFTCNCLSTWALFSWTTSTTHSYYNIIIINSSLIIFFLHWSDSKIFKSSEDTTRRSEGSGDNTPHLTTGFPSSSKNTASSTKNQTTTSKRKRERKERTPKECIRDPPELSRTRLSKRADLPVDLLLQIVKNGELLACYSELKNPYICNLMILVMLQKWSWWFSHLC